LPVGPQLLQPSGRFTYERPYDKRERKHLQPGVCLTARINLACQQRLCWRYACWLTMVAAVGVHRAHVAPRLGQSISSQALPPSGCEAPRGPETASGCVEILNGHHAPWGSCNISTRLRTRAIAYHASQEKTQRSETGNTAGSQSCWLCNMTRSNCSTACMTLQR
jgi:hypothetical protein